MIEENTVFVLGAGASVPFGLPTGAQLRTLICSASSGSGEIFGRLSECGFAVGEIVHFSSEFLRSGLASIDAFIARRPEFKELGELSIAAALIPRESALALNNVRGGAGDGDWYQYLWNILVSEARSPEDLLRNQVSFVSFNYDRSLEAYFATAIAATYGLSEVEAHSILGRLEIRHVYGELGPFSGVRALPYGGIDGPALLNAMRDARSYIRTVPDRREDADETCRGWIAHAKKIFVLGFSFDPTNCKRIGLPDACSLSAEVNPRGVAFASAFGMTQGEMSAAESIVGGKKRHGGIRFTSGTCLDLLRNHRDRITS